MNRPVLLVAALATALLASACGATVETSTAPATTGFPVTVQNCGAPLTLDAAPQRAVSNDVGITEMLFALGLTDRMAGYTIDQQDQSLATSPWRGQFADVPRLGKDLTKEVVQGANADLVYAGWNYGFRDSSGITPDAFTALGTPSYVLSESCRQPGGKARGIMAPLDALYTDITNLGALFGVPDRAAALVAQYRQTVATASASVPPQRPRPKVFLYDGGTDAPFTSGRFAGPQEIISRAGGDNIFGTLDNSWTTVGWEPVIAADPDVIIINDYGTPSAAQKIAFLESFAPMAGVTAVQEKRFFVLPYAALVEGPRNPQAVADFAAFLNGLPATS